MQNSGIQHGNVFAKAAGSPAVSAKKGMMCLGRKNWKKGGVVAMVGLECDDDNCDWIKGKSNRRRSGVQTEIGDNFSLRFFGLVSRRRGFVVWLRIYGMLN